MSMVIGTKTISPKIQLPLTEAELEIARLLLEFVMERQKARADGGNGDVANGKQTALVEDD